MRALKLVEGNGFIDIDAMKYMSYWSSSYSSSHTRWYIVVSFGGEAVTVCTFTRETRREKETIEYLNGKIDKILYYKFNPSKGKDILLWEEL